MIKAIADRSANQYIWFGTLGSTILHAPIWAFVQGVLPFVLFKSLEVSPTLLAIFIALKPASGLLAPWWQLFGQHHSRFLHQNLQWSCWLGGIPFVLGYWISHPLFWIASCGWFLILAKGRQGVWAEMMRLISDEHLRVRLTTRSNALGYGLGMTLPVLMGFLLDRDPTCWNLVAACAGGCLVASGFLQRLLPTKPFSGSVKPRPPLREALKVISQFPLFARYQIAQMLAGAGLMIIQPMIPSLLMDRFTLGYADCALLFGACKAAGYVLSSRLWGRIFPRIGVIAVSASAASLGFLFVFVLGIASVPSSLALAYLLYGFMQAGSELTWHMAPIHFGKDSSALPFSAAATFLMGLRGATIPVFGTWLLTTQGQNAPFFFGTLFSLSGAIGFWLLVRLQRREASDATYRSGLSTQDIL